MIACLATVVDCNENMKSIYKQNQYLKKNRLKLLQDCKMSLTLASEEYHTS